MHVLAQKIRLLRIILQVCPHLFGRCIHTAFHIADFIKLPVPEHALIMNHPGRVLFMEIPAHGQDTGSGIGFIAAGPPQDAGMVLIPLQHGRSPVHHTGLPLRQASRNVPGWFTSAHFLPGSMAFQVCLIHDIDSVFIAKPVPEALVRIMAGAHRIDVVALEDFDVTAHILGRDGAAPSGIPLMAVHAIDDDAFTVHQHDLILDFKTAEPGL